MGTWRVEFANPTGVHVEYITGTHTQMVQYVKRTEKAYGAKASTPEKSATPVNLAWNASKTNLTR